MQIQRSYKQTVFLMKGFLTVFFIILLVYPVLSQSSSNWFKAPDNDKKTDKKNQKMSEYIGNVVDKRTITKDNSTSGYSGEISTKKLAKKVKKARKREGQMNEYMGNVPYVDFKAKHALSAKKTSAYTGNISLNKYRKSIKNARDTEKEMHSYSGDIRYVNFKDNYRKKSAKFAAFKGANPILVKKKPKGSITSDYKGAPNTNTRPVKYNKQRLKTGKPVKKSELPNYQKEKQPKLRYNSRETKMWLENGGENMPKVPDRKTPKPVKQKKSKGKARDNVTNPETEGQE